MGSFGKFYLPVLLHCHAHKIPGNTFDLSLQHYRTASFDAILYQLIRITEKVPIAMTEEKKEAVQRAVRNARDYNMPRSTDYSYDNSWSSSMDDGCIDPEAMVEMRDHSCKEMQKIKVGDELRVGKVQYILRVHFRSDVVLYCGLTGSHPMLSDYMNERHFVVERKWGRMKNIYLPKHLMKTCSGGCVLYDVVTEGRMAMIVNNHTVATLGMACDPLNHPYYGTEKVVEEIAARAVDGIVDAYEEDFRYDPNGFISTIFKPMR